RTDRPERRFKLGASLRVDDAAPSAPARLTLRSYRATQGGAVAGFAEIADRDAAEALRGAGLMAEVDPAAEDDDGWYPAELRGAKVELPDGTEVGRVRDLLPGAAQDLLEIDQTDGTTALVPLVEQLVPVVDAVGGRIVIDPPAGLVAARPAGD
ncbi:MAG: ribosome maturation factor RimM, partial [Bifidobacteriaceae bacterium]|nr:ribosome maturation factor RimM [Bifidobacteriaceae bacterium]